MGEQNNVSTQNKDENPVANGCANGCGCLCLVISCLICVMGLLHTLSTPIKRIIELLFDE